MVDLSIYSIASQLRSENMGNIDENNDIVIFSAYFQMKICSVEIYFSTDSRFTDIPT